MISSRKNQTKNCSFFKRNYSFCVEISNYDVIKSRFWSVDFRHHLFTRHHSFVSGTILRLRKEPALSKREQGQILATSPLQPHS